jgi:hypothetical protein
MANHNTPQLSRTDLANHCAAFPGLSRLNTRAVLAFKNLTNLYYITEVCTPHISTNTDTPKTSLTDGSTEASPAKLDTKGMGLPFSQQFKNKILDTPCHMSRMTEFEECGPFRGMIGKGNQCTRRKPA